MSVQPRGWGSPLPHLVQSVQRALRVLEVVAENPDGITAKAVARRLDLALSTTYHLLNTLVAEGYVVRLEGMRGFGLGYKIPTLDRVLRRKLGVSPAVAAAVDDVHRRAGAAAYYAIYRDREVVIAYVADSALTPRVDPLDVGFHQAAHALAFGKVMLASLTPADRREYLSERGLPVFTEHTMTEGARLERDLDEVARLGIGADVEESARPGLRGGAGGGRRRRRDRRGLGVGPGRDHRRDAPAAGGGRARRGRPHLPRRGPGQLSGPT